MQRPNLGLKPTKGKQEIQLTATQTFYSGPVVHPDIAAQWEEICPGSADRILHQFEQQSSHRQKLEMKGLEQNNVKEILGQIFAFLIFMTATIGGIYLIANGYSIQGLIALIAALVTPLILFIVGRKISIKDLLLKKAQVEAQMQSQQQNPLKQ